MANRCTKVKRICAYGKAAIATTITSTINGGVPACLSFLFVYL
jgi:hypothetical protein